MRHETETVDFERVPQRQQSAIDIRTAPFGIGDHVGEQREPCGDIGCRGRHGRGRGEQRLLTGGLDIVARRTIETGERRARGQNLRVQLGRTHFEIAAFGAAIADGDGVEKGPRQGAPSTAPSTTTLTRANVLVRVQSNASAQTKTSNAADPAATHKRKAEFPMSGSMPNINPPQFGTALHKRAEYDAAAPQAPAV